VDVSKGHLKLAEEFCLESGISNINWIHLDSLSGLAALPEVDAFYSRIVLQHNPPPVSQFILKNLLAKLNPGGVGFFQVPTYMQGYQFNIDPYLEASREATQMEMHPIPQSRIFKICEDENVRVLEVFEDQCCRDVEGISNTFVVQKRH
jgi:SAM-dependent methyltransferase